SGKYINADIIKKNTNISDMDAAKTAESMREYELEYSNDFTFETVLSTTRNLDLLCRAKEKGYFIRGYYVLTCSADINVARVKSRAAIGGHDVPENKIRERYQRALALIPKFIEVCDICSIYDNSLDKPFRIYKKHHGDIIQSNAVWSIDEIVQLLNGTYIK
ncbi:MAG: hypothetical protein NC227_10725, partial [Bacteroides sp.]|nr:hypothetical protein [Bacteroides sp.]